MHTLLLKEKSEGKTYFLCITCILNSYFFCPVKLTEVSLFLSSLNRGVQNNTWNVLFWFKQDMLGHSANCLEHFCFTRVLCHYKRSTLPVGTKPPGISCFQLFCCLNLWAQSLTVTVTIFNVFCLKTIVHFITILV